MKTLKKYNYRLVLWRVMSTCDWLIETTCQNLLFQQWFLMEKSESFHFTKCGGVLTSAVFGEKRIFHSIRNLTLKKYFHLIHVCRWTWIWNEKYRTEKNSASEFTRLWFRVKHSKSWLVHHPNNEIIDKFILELEKYLVLLNQPTDVTYLCAICRKTVFFSSLRCASLSEHLFVLSAMMMTVLMHWFIFNWVYVNDFEWPALKWLDWAFTLGYSIPINCLNYLANLSLSHSCVHIRTGIFLAACFSCVRVKCMQLYPFGVIRAHVDSFYNIISVWNDHLKRKIKKLKCISRLKYSNLSWKKWQLDYKIVCEWRLVYKKVVENMVKNRNCQWDDRWPSSKSASAAAAAATWVQVQILFVALVDFNEWWIHDDSRRTTNGWWLHSKLGHYHLLCWKINECIWTYVSERNETKRKVICNILYCAATTSITKQYIFHLVLRSRFFSLSLVLLSLKICSDFVLYFGSEKKNCGAVLIISSFLFLFVHQVLNPFIGNLMLSRPVHGVTVRRAASVLRICERSNNTNFAVG